MIPQAKQTSSLRMLCDEKIGVLGLGVPAQPFKHERPGGQLRDALAQEPADLGLRLGGDTVARVFSL